MKNLKIFTENIEEEARKQIEELLEQEAFKDSKVRIMPDVHAGKGCVIGFTGDLGDKVIPAVTGVDIGCGMLCVELGKIDLDLVKLDKIIREYVPSGMNVHKEYIKKISTISLDVDEVNISDLRCYKELKNKDNWLEKSLGTLGGGNHFIEVDVDEDGNKYLVIHTGSRNLGKQVAEIYQEKAIKYCSYEKEAKEEREKIIKEYKEQGREREIQAELNKISEKYKDKTKLPKDLCYLEGDLRADYLHDMEICQKFASLNRTKIAKIIIKNIFDPKNTMVFNNYCFEDNKIIITGITRLIIKYDENGGNSKFLENYNCFETIHNYISFEDNIVRKGAISAKKGERVLIPMNMRDGCIIGIGKGNEDWNCSAPHGAGRIMSRAKARENIKMEDFESSMEGIYTTSVSKETIDESPFAYKPMQEIIDCIGDTIEIEKIIKPIYNFKAGE